MEPHFKFLFACPENFTDETFTKVKSTQDAHSKAILDLSRKETLRDAEIVVLFTVELLSKICDKVNLCPSSISFSFVASCEQILN